MSKPVGNSPYNSKRFVTICAALLALAALLPLPLGWSGGAHAAILGLGLVLGGVLTTAQPEEWRRSFRDIWLLGLTTRVIAHLVIFAWASAADGPFLSPDATLYFAESLRLALQDMQLPVPPYVFFGTFDCAHYYLFAAARLFLSAGLFDLQLVNVILSALAGPLTFAIARRLSLPYATRVGIAVALYPSLIALSVNDLMKDASVIGLFMVGTWAVVELWVRPGTLARRVGLVAVAACALSYVRMSRFYVPAFLELAILMALALAALKHMQRSSVALASRSAALGLLLVVALVEGIPMWLGWPPSPVMVWQVMNHSLETPEMRLSAVGLVDRLQAGGRVRPRHAGDLSASGNVSVRASDIVADVRRTAGTRRMSAVPTPEETATLEPVEPLQLQVPLTATQRMARLAANLIRKLLGPFPWVMPPSWDARTVLVGDYLMFPGMILWYLVLPLAVVGLVLVPWQALRRQEFAYPLLALTGFVGILFAQYLTLNLSYRQREFMFPFLALGATFAFSQRTDSKWPGRFYGVYLLGLLAFAALHLMIRAGWR